MDLFEFQMQENLKTSAPLAERMRPRNLREYIGQEHVAGEGKYIPRLMQAGFLPSLLFYGPPGIGKTTLAEIVARESKMEFVPISAVTSNVKELRQILKAAEERLGASGRKTVLFLDEIHRFNKSQQDVLLPYVERGKVVLMGATTENPYFYVNSALLSRLQVVRLTTLDEGDIERIVRRALADSERGYGDMAIEFTDVGFRRLIESAGGDGRRALNILEVCVLSTKPSSDGVIRIDEQDVADSTLENPRLYDRDGNEHYDAISAFIKSIRGSDPDAAVFYLAKMLQSGEDPEYIARRMIISASEDISNADPRALAVAVDAFYAFRVIGMPEGRIILAQAATYLASAPKSNRSYVAVNAAMADVDRGIGTVIPLYLRDQHQPMEEHAEYKYPHNYENAYVKQRYLPEDMEEKTYYTPSTRGYEKMMRAYLDRIKRQEDDFGNS